jgi:Xaa-Pro aminopeptidase
MNDRTKRLLARLSELSLDGALATSYENRRYLSGFSGSSATLLVCKASQVLYTDFRYGEQAQSEAPDFETVICNQFAGLSEAIVNLASAQGLARIGFESDKVTVAWLDEMTKAMPTLEFVPMPGEIDKLRWTKDEAEIEAISRSQAVTDAAFLDILSRIRPGVSEIELMSELNYFMTKHGASPAFDTIVAGGPHSSMPHAQPTDRKLCSGDFLTMDFGAKIDGYCSDMTRTVAVGTPSPEMVKIYGIVLSAQQRALDKIAPGMVCKDVDHAARGFIADNGYGECFGHGLGHGFGLLIHEEPRFSPMCDDVLKPGICMSVEPGIYLAGKFGVRIEDTVCITKDGFQNFTHAPKELIIL